MTTAPAGKSGAPAGAGPGTGRPTDRQSGRRSDRRTQARIAAVQALYQLSATDAAPDDVVDEFRLHRMREAGPAAAADKALFTEIVQGACSDRAALNRMIEGSLSENWALERMDRVLVALLNAGAWELHGRSETPARVVIAEYVDVARVFFDNREPAFVNGMLDRLARTLRSGEFSEATDLHETVENAGPVEPET
ncbi:MAG: transcription antitermination factor NusB [Rhodospirillaceae bacterium]|nr:transcription antitermination factor NusB [Rhodospirillaceae bacterium]